MDLENIPKSVIAITVAFIMVVLVAVPILDSITLGEISTVDGDRYRMMTEDDVIIYNTEDRDHFIINGVKQEMDVVSFLGGGVATNVVSQSFFFIQGSRGFQLRYTGDFDGDSNGVIYLTASGDYTITTKGIETPNLGFSKFAEGTAFLKSPSGEYTNVIGKTVPLSNSALYGYGTSMGSGMYITLDKNQVTRGPSVMDGGRLGAVNTETITVTENTISYSDPLVVSNELDDSEIQVLLAPYEVTVISDDNAAVQRMIDIIPLIMVIGILLVAVGLFLRSRS